MLGDIVWWVIGGLMSTIGVLMWALIRGGSERRDLKQESDAHARINEADLGIGAADADNAEWLRNFGRKHRRG